jgi:hypothetical protein
MEILSFLGADIIHSAAFRGLALCLEVVLLALACFVVFEGFRRIGRDGISMRVIVVVLLSLPVAVMSGVKVAEGLLGY